MKKRNLLVALAAGLIGGVCSHFFFPQFVHAASGTPALRELRAQRFILVNEKGVVLGTFTEGAKDRPVLRLFDASGREIWSAGDVGLTRPHTGK